MAGAVYSARTTEIYSPKSSDGLGADSSCPYNLLLFVLSTTVLEYIRCDIFGHDRNIFCERSKFLGKIEIFGKGQNFCERSKFFWKFESFVKMETLQIETSERSKFLGRSNFWKDRNFWEKSKFLGNIEIFGKHRNFW